ncbi:carbon storage regulator [Adhaeretor mobilis]|uniref:Translational regulator CsrA n=1 Tax=Adhaeretor mobilis TaxID=1930276 RepID=A0A517MUS8_9BACT|nr:carbon storage regulator [Adhaeretor mobilis]QDS98643.1 Carbon storage regulator [Adhaeretor mobilis]
MLVIARKPGERLLIGDNITITVVKLSSGGVRLGIEAPPEMAIMRQELADALQAAEQQAINDAEQQTANEPATS